jgi:molecular chaperone DnaK
MVREGEEHAAEDKKRREEADTRNAAEGLVYQIEKLIKENDEKLPEDVKTSVQADVDALKTALAGDDIEAVKTALDKLNESQQKLGEAIYAAQPAEGEAAAEEASGEDVVDAEVVDDEESDKKDA